MDFKEIENKIENFGRDNIMYWAVALAGETGEYCNLVKKGIRCDSKLDYEKLMEELADIFIYVVLNARYFGLDLENAILSKIKKVKKRRS